MSDVYATLWGLIAFSGFVTTLLVPQADRYAKEFREAVTEAALDGARRWAGVVRQVPVLVLVLVAALAVLSPVALRNGPARATAWDFTLLTVAVVSQTGFVVTVRSLVPYVPTAITPIPPVPVDGRRAGLTSSLRGAQTAIRFVNRTDQVLGLKWIDFEGSLVGYGSVPPHSEDTTQITFVGHWFVITAADGRELALFEAQPSPAVANIDDAVLTADSL